MKHNIFSLFFLFVFPLAAFAQIVKPGENFTNVHVFDGKVVFLKEIQLKDVLVEKNHAMLRDWAKSEYAADPFNSSIDYDTKNGRIKVASRVELILSERPDGTMEKMIMKYRLDAFIKNDLCVMEITNISYLNNPKKNKNFLPDKIKAENMISDEAIQINDPNQKVRIETRKNTLYFLNGLALDLQKMFNN